MDTYIHTHRLAQEKEELNEVIEAAIMATDMGVHKEICSALKSKAEDVTAALTPTRAQGHKASEQAGSHGWQSYDSHAQKAHDVKSDLDDGGNGWGRQSHRCRNVDEYTEEDVEQLASRQLNGERPRDDGSHHHHDHHDQHQQQHQQSAQHAHENGQKMERGDSKEDAQACHAHGQSDERRSADGSHVRHTSSSDQQEPHTQNDGANGNAHPSGHTHQSKANLTYPALPGFSADSLSDRVFLVRSIVHTADLSGQAMPPEVAYNFGAGVLREFHNQYGTEMAQGLPLSDYMKVHCASHSLFGPQVCLLYVHARVFLLGLPILVYTSVEHTYMSMYLCTYMYVYMYVYIYIYIYIYIYCSRRMLAHITKQDLETPLGQAKAQLGFIGFVVLPLWASMGTLFESLKVTDSRYDIACVCICIFVLTCVVYMSCTYVCAAASEGATRTLCVSAHITQLSMDRVTESYCT